MSDDVTWEDRTMYDAAASSKVLRESQLPDDMMTIEDVLEEVERIRLGRFDPEQAHSREDALHQRVLEEIADGALNASFYAEAALKTREIDFPRWCA